jgi:hypothetical protein
VRGGVVRLLLPGGHAVRLHPAAGRQRLSHDAHVARRRARTSTTAQTTPPTTAAETQPTRQTQQTSDDNNSDDGHNTSTADATRGVGAAGGWESCMRLSRPPKAREEKLTARRWLPWPYYRGLITQCGEKNDRNEL